MDFKFHRKIALYCVQYGMYLSMFLFSHSVYSDLHVSDLKVVASGPRTVGVGDEFEYTLTISNSSSSNIEMVLLYYYPPKELEYVSMYCTSNCMELCCLDDLECVFGEAYELEKGKTVSIIIKVKAKELSLLENATTKETASYFSFIVAEDGVEREFSKRKALTITVPIDKNI